MSATSSRSRSWLTPVPASSRIAAVVTWRTPGAASSDIAWWKPGVVMARIAGLTSGPRPPDDTSTSRSARSGNW